MQKLINRCNQINNGIKIKKKKNGFSFFKKKSKSPDKNKTNIPKSIKRFYDEANKDFTFSVCLRNDKKIK
jgi:hypothetical protein